MNTQDKEHALKQFLQSLATHVKPPPSTLPSMVLPPTPQIDLISQLLSHEKQINDTVSKTYKQVKNVLQQLSELQTRKQNINKLLDSMTAMKQIKRLSFGLGTSPQEIYRNLVSYYQVKDKVYYCEKYVQKVEEEITKVKVNFEQELQQQLRKTNSQNISQLSKTLSLILSGSASSAISPDFQITEFYTGQLKRELKIYEQDLFKIPISGSSSGNSAGASISSNNYLFFDIAKDIMKSVVTMLNNFRANILKVAGQSGFEKVIVAMFGLIMTGIMLEIFMREKKYFDIDSLDTKKLTKSLRFKDYLNEFCAIWNQIQRLKSHLLLQVPESSPSRKELENNLNNSTNTKQLITINHQASQGIKIYTRFEFNNLLKTSTFVNSIFQMDYQFLQKIYENFQKNNSNLMDSHDAQEFVVDTFSIIMKSLEKAFESLNMLIISPLITFANTNLIQEDSFHAFTQLFNKITSKMNIGQQKYYTALIILLNTIIIMPNILRTEIINFKIPSQLDNYRVRLQNELKQLGQVCQYKAKQVINSFISAIVESNWFFNEIKQDYRKAIEKWKGLAQEVSELFLNKASQVHCSVIMNDEFNLKQSKKIISQQGILSLQKEVRTIITYYEVKGCPALNSFRKVLQYIEILLAEGQQNAEKLMKKFNIWDKEQTKKIGLLRAMKTD